jgi:opacity protein-like surface antigen
LSTGADWAAGAARRAADFGRQVGTYVQDPTFRSRLETAMAVATTVGEQLEAFRGGVMQLQQRIGRQLSRSEVEQLERNVWGRPVGTTSAPGIAGNAVLPLAVAGIGLATNNKLLALAGIGWAVFQGAQQLGGCDGCQQG